MGEKLLAFATLGALGGMLGLLVKNPAGTKALIDGTGNILSTVYRGASGAYA